MGNIAIPPSRQPLWAILSSGCRFRVIATPPAARSSCPDHVRIHYSFAFVPELLQALSFHRALLTPPTSLCPAPPLTVEGLPPHWRRSRPFLLAAFYLSSGCRATFIGRASPLQNPACYPSAGEFSLSVAGPPFPTGRRPPGRESWPSEPPSGRRPPRGKPRIAPGFSLSGSPYPGAAARRRDPALSIPIVRPGTAEPRNSGHGGGAGNVFLFVRGGGVPTRISTWQRAIPAAHHSHWLRSLAMQSDHQ